MSKKKMEYLYKNSGHWYVRYKDPVTGKWKSVSTKLKAIDKNIHRAKEIRDEFLEEIKKYELLETREGTISQAYSHFLEINDNKSKSTKATYSIFYDYLIQKIDPNSQCSVITKKTSEEFLLWLNKQTHLQQNSKYGIQKNFLKFLGFLFEYEYVTKIFIINKDVKIRPKVNELLIFADADRKSILDGLVTEDKNGNFKTMVYMLMFTGLRPSDIINITTNRIDLTKMEMKFYSSKIDKWFIRPIHPILKEVLSKRIIEVKSGKILEYSDSKIMGKAFHRYLAKIKLDDKGYTLRTFRKDFISRCQEAGISISATSVLVGHSNIKTTMTYYTKLSANHLQNELNKLK